MVLMLSFGKCTEQIGATIVRLPSGGPAGPCSASFFHLTVNQCPFHGLCGATFFKFLCLLMISLFKKAPKRSPEVLAPVPKHKKVTMCLLENYMYEIGFVQI